MKRKWQVGDEEDHTLDESVESSLDRIGNAFQNPRTWEEVMLKRLDAVERQRNLKFDSTRKCGGFGFMNTGIWPKLLLEHLLKWGGYINGPKISFNCFYGPKIQSKSTALLASRKNKLCFKNASCFGCETLKDIAAHTITDYFINIKVSIIYTIYPNHKLHQLSNPFPSRNWINGWGYGLISLKEYFKHFRMLLNIEKLWKKLMLWKILLLLKLIE
jgi:hypothetical protein